MELNDIVVLKNGLNSFYLVLEMEKHLFEIVEIVGDIVRLKSLSTGVIIRHELESIRLATLKERYLVDGNVVELENGKRFVVINKYMTNDETFENLITFNDILDSKYSKVVKVYEYMNIIQNHNGSDFISMLNINKNHKLLWQRSIELTDDEKVILRNLKVVNDGISKYISRNKNNKLLLRENKDDNYVLPLSNFNHLFKSITHESGIHEIKELLK